MENRGGKKINRAETGACPASALPPLPAMSFLRLFPAPTSPASVPLPASVRFFLPEMFPFPCIGIEFVTSCFCLCFFFCVPGNSPLDPCPLHWTLSRLSRVQTTLTEAEMRSESSDDEFPFFLSFFSEGDLALEHLLEHFTGASWWICGFVRGLSVFRRQAEISCCGRRSAEKTSHFQPQARIMTLQRGLVGRNTGTSDSFSTILARLPYVTHRLWWRNGRG
jgi:hypothetical protein